MTGEHLGHQPNVIEEAEFDHSSLGKIFHKGLDEGDKKEGLLKSVKNIGIKMKSSWNQLKIKMKSS